MINRINSVAIDGLVLIPFYRSNQSNRIKNGNNNNNINRSLNPFLQVKSIKHKRGDQLVVNCGAVLIPFYRSNQSNNTIQNYYSNGEIAQVLIPFYRSNQSNESARRAILNADEDGLNPFLQVKSIKR